MYEEDYENSLIYEVEDGEEFTEEDNFFEQKQDIDDVTLLEEFEIYYKQKPLAQVLIDEVISAPLVGLEFIIEIQKNKNLGQCSFVCTLCDKASVSYTLIAHTRSLPHRLKLVEKQFPGIYKEFGCINSKQWSGPRVKEFNNLLQQIEKKIGRGTLAVTVFEKKDNAVKALRKKIEILPRLSIFNCVSYSSFEEQQNKIRLTEIEERKRKEEEIKRLQQERRMKLKEEAREKEMKEKEMIQRYREKQAVERRQKEAEREERQKEREKEREGRQKQRDKEKEERPREHHDIRTPLLSNPKVPLLPDPIRRRSRSPIRLNRNRFNISRNSPVVDNGRDWQKEQNPEIVGTLVTVTERLGNRIGPKIMPGNESTDMDVEIYEEDAEEALPLFHSIWKQKKIILIGGEVCANLGQPSSYIPDVVIKSKKKVTINEVIEMVDQNVNQNFDYVIIFPFQRTFLNLVKLGLHQGSPVMIEAKDNVPTSLLPEVMSYTKLWRSKYPCTEFIWALPYPLDFQANNISRELASLKGNLPPNFKSLVVQSDSIAHAHKYYNNLVLFRKKWDRVNPNVPYIDMSSIFLQPSEEMMMEEPCAPIIWPEGMTLDGVLPSSKFASDFWKKTFDVLFDLWSNKFFKVTKGIRSLTFAEDRNSYPKGDHFVRMDIKTKGSQDVSRWMGQNTIFVGDESYRSLMSVMDDPVLPRIMFISEKDLGFDRAIELVDSNLNKKLDMVIISPFVGESLYYQKNLTTNIRLAEPNTYDLRNFIPRIHKAYQKWTSRYPDVKVVWMCPFPINFEMYSNQIISSYYQKNPSAAIIQNKNELRKYHSMIYYNKVVAFSRQWLTDIPEVPFIFSIDVFLTAEEKDSFVSCRGTLQWPFGYTWDGLHALPKLATQFWNVVLKLSQGMDDSDYVIQRQYSLKKRLDKYDIPKSEQNNSNYMNEWGEFWARRSISLQEVGLDPAAYDFTEEWNYAWSKINCIRKEKVEVFSKAGNEANSQKEISQSDPRYNDEYAKFWKSRCAEIQGQGQKLILMDIKKEWFKFWEKRSKECMDIEVKADVKTAKIPLKFEVKPKPKDSKQIDEEKWKIKIEANELLVQQMETAQDETHKSIQQQLERKVKPILKGVKRPLVDDRYEVKKNFGRRLSSENGDKNISKLKNYVNQSFERQLEVKIDEKRKVKPLISANEKPKKTNLYSPIRCLTMMCELSGELGYLGPAILVMQKEALEMEEKNENAMSIFDDDENISLIHFAITKFKKIVSAKKDLDANKITFEEAVKSCEKLLQSVKKSPGGNKEVVETVCIDNVLASAQSRTKLEKQLPPKRVSRWEKTDIENKSSDYSKSREKVVESRKRSFSSFNKEQDFQNTSRVARDSVNVSSNSDHQFKQMFNSAISRTERDHTTHSHSVKSSIHDSYKYKKLEREESRAPPPPTFESGLDFNDAGAIKDLLERMQGSQSMHLKTPGVSNSHRQPQENPTSMGGLPEFKEPFQSFNTSLKVVAKEPLLKTPSIKNRSSFPLNAAGSFYDKSERGNSHNSLWNNSSNSNSMNLPKMSAEYGRSIASHSRFDNLDEATIMSEPSVPRSDSIFANQGRSRTDGSSTNRNDGFSENKKGNGCTNNNTMEFSNRTSNLSQSKTHGFPNRSHDVAAYNSEGSKKFYDNAHNQGFSDRRTSGYSESKTNRGRSLLPHPSSIKKTERSSSRHSESGFGNEWNDSSLSKFEFRGGGNPTLYEKPYSPCDNWDSKSNREY